ncbi:MAG TPA: hypothetical protein VLC79_03640 [Cellvibrio sp.]|nr:hypothetical protein [Cellvibrio sp.]
MKKTVAIQLAFSCFVLLSAKLYAETLPQSGTINIQSIVKAGAPAKFNDDYSHNGVTGVTFNEKGSGPLHLGKVACSISSFTRREINRQIGFCTFEDKDGDNIFIQYAGGSHANNEFNAASDIMGGTGKFEGIRGVGSSACANTDSKGEFPCTEKIDYQLPQ